MPPRGARSSRSSRGGGGAGATSTPDGQHAGAMQLDDAPRAGAGGVGGRRGRLSEATTPLNQGGASKSPAGGGGGGNNSSFAHSLSRDLSRDNLSRDQIDNLRRQSNLSTLSLSPRRPGTSGTVASAGGTSGTATLPGGAGSGKGKGRAGAGGGKGKKAARFGDLGAGFTSPELRPDLDDDDEDGMLLRAEGESYEDDWTLVDRMRCWRNDAMTQHLYGTAEFWGSKVFGMTGNPNDAFWLAQTHFLTHQYAQASLVLLTPRSPRPRAADTNSPLASSRRPFPRGGGGHPDEADDEDQEPEEEEKLPQRRLTDSSLACRYLAAQCAVRLGKWEDALDLVGRSSDLWGDAPSSSLGGAAAAGGERPGDGGVKFTASMAHLRGLIMLHLGAAEEAKKAFMAALAADVKCFESFEMLVGGEMMSNEEEWEFIQGLEFVAQAGDDADFVRMMYSVRLKKYTHRAELEEARDRLASDFDLADDPDVLFAKADQLYTAMKYGDCFKVTSRILALHHSHRPTLPLHLSCMHHLPQLRSRLFLLAHQMVESTPDDAQSWYAVGLWYFSGRRWEEARRFFGKAVLLDSRFGPAWIAFAHSYAFEGEHDQAITAYSTALRHFQGTHLPLLFVGMQHLGLSNVNLAQEYLTASKALCPEDPLVLNELGVVEIYKEDYHAAVHCFTAALDLTLKLQSTPSTWVTTHYNLGHALRKLGEHRKAQVCFRRVIELDPRYAAAYTGLGLVDHLLGNLQDAVGRYHESLAIAPSDPVTCDLLRLALRDATETLSFTDFPGLPASKLAKLDEKADKLTANILAGNDTVDTDPEKDEGRAVQGNLRTGIVDRSNVSLGLGSRSTDEEESMLLDDG